MVVGAYFLPNVHAYPLNFITQSLFSQLETPGHGGLETIWDSLLSDILPIGTNFLEENELKQSFHGD